MRFHSAMRYLKDARIFFFVCIFRESFSYSYEMTRPVFCKLVMEEGTKIMGSFATISNSSALKIMRNEQLLQNGDHFFPSENLTVSLYPMVAQVVFEADCGAYFFDGYCSGKRMIDRAASIRMPSEPCNVTFTAAWAYSYKHGVKLSPSVTLIFVSGKHDEFLDDMNIRRRKAKMRSRKSQAKRFRRFE